MTIIERITKEIAKLEGCFPECNHCKKVAKNVILAMREPTEEMLADCDSSLMYGEIIQIYNSLIDAALKE